MTRGQTLAGVLCLAALGLAGCGNGENRGSEVGKGAIRSVSVVTTGGDFKEAIDATPSPSGVEVYFTATSSRGPGVFAVPASGGLVRTVAFGEPFRKPVGIASDADGGRLYVADPEAVVDGKRGAIVAISFNGAPRTVVRGSEGTAPRGIEVVRQAEADTVYFTGRDAVDGAPGVFKVPAAGGTGAPVVKGAPLVSPDAVTVTKSGDVYVTDRGPVPDGSRAAVFRIARGTTERITDFHAPVLAGVTLTLDESLLLVSSLSDEGSDQVLIVDLASGRTGAFADVIGENRAGAGLHRAHRADVFAWADIKAGPDRQSQVYVLRP